MGDRTLSRLTGGALQHITNNGHPDTWEPPAQQAAPPRLVRRMGRRPISDVGKRREPNTLATGDLLLSERVASFLGPAGAAILSAEKVSGKPRCISGAREEVERALYPWPPRFGTCVATDSAAAAGSPSSVGTRPNGPAEPSPGLRPQADALGKQETPLQAEHAQSSRGYSEEVDEAS